MGLLLLLGCSQTEEEQGKQMLEDIMEYQEKSQTDDLIVEDQILGPGNTLTIKSVTLKAPGFVDISSSNYRSQSKLLAAGTHENVKILIENPDMHYGATAYLWNDNGDGVFEPGMDKSVDTDEGYWVQDSFKVSFPLPGSLSILTDISFKGEQINNCQIDSKVQGSPIESFRTMMEEPLALKSGHRAGLRSDQQFNPLIGKDVYSKTLYIDYEKATIILELNCEGTPDQNANARFEEILSQI